MANIQQYNVNVLEDAPKGFTFQPIVKAKGKTALLPHTPEYIREFLERCRPEVLKEISDAQANFDRMVAHLLLLLGKPTAEEMRVLRGAKNCEDIFGEEAVRSLKTAKLRIRIAIHAANGNHDEYIKARDKFLERQQEDCDTMLFDADGSHKDDMVAFTDDTGHTEMMSVRMDEAVRRIGKQVSEHHTYYKDGSGMETFARCWGAFKMVV